MTGKELLEKKLKYLQKLAQKEKENILEQKCDDDGVDDEVTADSDTLTSPSHHSNVVVDYEVHDDSDTLESPIHHPDDVVDDEVNDDSDTPTSPNHHRNDVGQDEVHEDSDRLIVYQKATITATALGQSLSPATPVFEEKIEDDEQEEISDSVLQHFLNNTMAEETTKSSVLAAALGMTPTTTSLSSLCTQQPQTPEGSSSEDDDMPDIFEDALSIHAYDDDEAEVLRAVVFLDEPYSTQTIVQFLHAGLVATAGILYFRSNNK
jgi:hypothetical protein